MLRPQIAPLMRNMKVRDFNVLCLLPTHKVEGGEVAVGALTRFEQTCWVWPQVHWSTHSLQPLLLPLPPPAAGPALLND